MTPYDSYVTLIQQLDDLIALFEQHPDPVTREQVGALLSGLDALHREGLRRLVGTLREFGSDALIEQATRDQIVKTLLGLYDLVPLELPAEEPARPAPAKAFIPLERVASRNGPPPSRRPQASAQGTDPADAVSP